MLFSLQTQTQTFIKLGKNNAYMNISMCTISLTQQQQNRYLREK